jgi:cAMP-binding proteins - catabolite gene activator and regulatory subunit of cAMP-dependent protein kinases
MKLTQPVMTAWCETADCSMCTMRASVLFAGIDAALLRRIQHDIDEQRLLRGESLYHMGDAGRAIFTVREGLVKLVQYLPDGGERIVRLVRATDVTGLEALVGQSYQHDAIVEQEGVICRIPVDVVRRLELESPQLYRELMRRWQQALSEADAWLTELGTGSARQRVARLLLRLTDEAGNGLCNLFSRKDMGAMLGITTESASRMVAELKRAGMLSERAGSFHCDRAALERVAAE